MVIIFAHLPVVLCWKTSDDEVDPGKGSLPFLKAGLKADL